jgi:hypothetical protein
MRSAARTALAIGLAAAAAAGCGAKTSEHKVAGTTPVPNPQGTADPDMDPLQATCEEYLNSPQLYSQATVKLARRVHRRDASEFQVTLRLRNAVTAICKQAEPSSRPGKAALEAVRNGKYKTDRG